MWNSCSDAAWATTRRSSSPQPRGWLGRDSRVSGNAIPHHHLVLREVKQIAASQNTAAVHCGAQTMLTTDEIRAVPLFSTLDLGGLEQLARTSEDLRLKPGEFAVHEGDERALFAVLAGKVEV